MSGVTLKWEAAYGKAYEIRVSTDSIEWTTVFSTNASNGGTDMIDFESIDTRYIMMYGIERATIWKYSFYEFEAKKNPDVSIIENEKLTDQFVMLSSYPNKYLKLLLN